MRSVFVGMGAFIGRIDGDTRCAFWAEEPTDHGFDPSRLITIDLARTPEAAAARKLSWDAVEVDDGVVGPSGHLAGTTIGPRWPEMQLAGAVYLEQAIVAKLPPSARPTPMKGYDYEYQRAVYWSHIDDPRAGRRYVGHYAEILEERGSLARVAVYHAGTAGTSGARCVTVWVDFAAADQCDAGRDSLTQIGVGAAPKKGALFLSAGKVRASPRVDANGTAAGPEEEPFWPINGPKVPHQEAGPEEEPFWPINGPKIPHDEAGPEEEPFWPINGPKIPHTEGGPVDVPWPFDGPKLPIGKGV